MKLAITGFANSGKTTVFNALSGQNLDTSTYPTPITAETKPHIGIIKIPDRRLRQLSSIYKPKKTTPTTIEYIDYAGITPVSSGRDASHNTKIFDLIKESDAMVHVVRAFEDETILHPLGTVAPVRDVNSFETELICGDLEFVEKRIENIELSKKRGKQQDETDKQLLLKCKSTLEDEQLLRNIPFTEEEKKLMLPYQFLTTIPEIIVLNVAEKDMGSDHAKTLRAEIEAYFMQRKQKCFPPVVSLCGKIEMEIGQLPSDEARAFLDDLGIEEPAMHKLNRVSYDVLGLISFFTVIKDEVRAWTIQEGTEALKAAGKVHSDIERGFIKAEVVHFDDFDSSDGDMTKAKEKGLVRHEGKNYIVKDGDIINFKFNV